MNPPGAALQLAQASLLAAIVESSDDAIISETLEGIITSWNRAAERLYGYSAEEAIGRPVSMLIPPDRLDEERQLLARIGRGERVERMATVRLQKTGPPVTVRGTVSPIRDAAGDIVGASHIAHDITERKRVVAKLRYQAQLLAAVKDAIIGIDEQRIIKFWNPAAEAIYGWAADEVIGRSVIDVLQTEYDGTTRDDRRGSVLATGEYRGEVRQRRKDGSIVAIESVAKVLYDANGNDTGMVAINRDITRRKQLEASLRESQARIDSIEASIADTHVIFDRQWHYLFVNDAAARVIGLPREQILGRTLWELFPHMVGTELGRELQRAMNSRVLRAFDFRYMPMGTWWEHRCFPAPEGVAVFATNITERKQAELAHSQLAAIVESSDDAIFSKTLEGTILSWNRGAEQLYGYSADEAIGRPVSMLVHPEKAEELRGLMERLGRGEHIQHHETTRLKKDGIHVSVSVTLSPMRDSAGQIAGVSAIARDISERQQAAETSRRAATRTEALLRVAAALSSHLDLDKVVNTVCEETRQVMAVPIATLTLFDEARGVFQFAGGSGIPAGLAQQIRPIPLAFYAERLMPGGKLIYVPDVQAEAGWSNAAVHQALNMRTNVSALMIHEGRPLGTLRVATTGHARAFEPEALYLLQGLADVAALAIANAQLFQEVSTGRGRLQALSQRLLEAQEAERRHIARQLHDEIGQALTAVKINLQALQRTTGLAAGGQVDDSIGIVEETLERVRSLSVELRPAVLDDLGLAAALRWYVDRQAQRAGFQARVTADLPEGHLPGAVETASFRVAQEALTNVLRHAHAEHVEVELRHDGDGLELVIHDDGVGFDVPAALARAVRGGSLGLLGMQERVLLAGGDLKLESTPKQGSRVWARFPLERQAPVERRGPARKLE